ncbi:MAG: precorrin-6y C5,15-methyltransferase (decarboxylating) subunit CbiE [Pseudomonadota bacterium]|nr:precorrin-6y C5,15-methyltransferase (decarboxylating) subunit CbiE [Pseudomonadota bacterium]
MRSGDTAAAITVVGIGMNGELSPAAQAAVATAALLAGGTRQLALFPGGDAARFDFTGRMKELRPLLERTLAAGRACVVLASGDPLFFGIGSFLARHFRPPDIRFVPSPTAVTEAFARVGLAWEDAEILSVHGRPMADVAAALDRAGKVALLTDETNTPAAIGAVLGDRDGTAWVCERLGADDERVRELPLRDLAGIEADPLNVVILVGPRRPRATIPHTPDDAFEKKMPRKGLITKREVRTLSLAALGVTRGDVCWDIGAGSGAVAIEMALLGAARVCAIEKNADGCEIVRQNVASFATPQVEVVHAKAPDGLAALPDPDRVFVGGSGGNMGDLVALLLARLRPGGRLVVNVATIENLGECVAALKIAGAPWELTQVAIARSAPILDLTRLEALNPIWIVSASAPAPGSAAAPSPTEPA